MHVGIYVGNSTLLDANVYYPLRGGRSRPDGVHEEPLSWQLPFVGAVRFGGSSSGGGGGGTPSVSASNNNGQLAIQLSNFPLGVSYFFCHAGSGYPTGGSVPNHGSFNVTSPNQSWSSGLCAGSGNYWIGVQATNGQSYYSNQVALSGPTSPGVSQYAGHIVKWSGQTPSPVTSWHVTSDLKRLWIMNGGVYACLQAHGAAGPDLLPAATLNQLPDQTNEWATCGSSTVANQVLRRNMYMNSPDGRYHLWLQSDGNFVLYGPSGHALWALNEYSADFVAMQGDGNLVAYTNAGGVVWASNTAGVGATSLQLQSDGNVVLYTGSGHAVWSTGTSGRT